MPFGAFYFRGVSPFFRFQDIADRLSCGRDADLAVFRFALKEMPGVDQPAHST
jgi:hypothetical protein